MLSPAARGLVWSALLLFCAGSLGGCLQKRTIATVNGEAVTRDEFLDQLEARYGMQTLHWLILRELTKQALQKNNLTVTEAEVQEGMEEWKRLERITNDQLFKEYLAQRGLKEEDIREDIWMNLALDKLATKDVTVTEAEKKQYFEKHKDALGRPATVNIARIVCKDEQTAKKVYSQLNEGATFSEMAAQYSIDEATKGNGGMLPEMPRDALGDLAPVIDKLEVGQFTAPIKTQGAYHIIKLISKRAPEPAKYSEVSARIERGLKRQKGKNQDQVIQELLRNAVIDVKVPRYLKLEDMLMERAGKAPSPTQPAPPTPESKQGKGKGKDAKSGKS
jgi:parvulin-like peptidyl-prolyl isomerase